MEINRNYSGIIIENPKGELLFQLRDNKSGLPHPNKWSLFGGGIESGENSVQAILREVKEELGFDLVSKKTLDCFLKKNLKKKNAMYSIINLKKILQSLNWVRVKGLSFYDYEIYYSKKMLFLL